MIGRSIIGTRHSDLLGYRRMLSRDFATTIVEPRRCALTTVCERWPGHDNGFVGRNQMDSRLHHFVRQHEPHRKNRRRPACGGRLAVATTTPKMKAFLHGEQIAIMQ
jgi:hypothetical protein